MKDIYGFAAPDIGAAASRLAAALGVAFARYEDFLFGGEFYADEGSVEEPEYRLRHNRNLLHRPGDPPAKRYAEPDHPDMILLLVVEAAEAEAEALQATLPRRVPGLRFLKADDRPRRLLGRIEEAFRGVTLGGGVTLHETVWLDSPGGLRERQEARAADEKDDWRRLVGDPELARTVGVGGPHFYDAEGLRFHLPAYLSLVLQGRGRRDLDELLDVLASKLTCLSEHNLTKLALLDRQQRRCVRDVLAYLGEGGEAWEGCPELEQAVRGYWSE